MCSLRRTFQQSSRVIEYIFILCHAFLHRLNLIAHCSSFTSSSPFVWHVQSHGRAASSAKCRSLPAFFDMWNALLAHSVRGEEMWTRHLTRHTQVALERAKMLVLDTCKNENVNWLENVDNSHCHCTPFALVSLIDIGDIWLYCYIFHSLTT